MMTIRTILFTTTAAALVAGTIGWTALTGASSAQADTAVPTQPNQEALAQARQGGRPFDGAGPRQRGARITAAAEQLGVTEAELRAALGLPDQPVQPDFAGAAAQLGTTETELRNTLRQSRRLDSGASRPDFAAVAEQYGVTEAELLTALGVPAERPQPDIAAAAEQLGVSEADLREALWDGCPRGEFGRGPGAGRGR